MKNLPILVVLALMAGVFFLNGQPAGAQTISIDDANNTLSVTGANMGTAIAIRGTLTNVSANNYANAITAVFFREVGAGDIALADVTLSWWTGPTGWQPAGPQFKPTNYAGYEMELNIGGGGFPLPAGFVGAGTWIRAVANRNFGTIEGKVITYVPNDANNQYDAGEVIISELGPIDTDIKIDLLGFNLETVYVDDGWAACNVGNPALNVPVQEVSPGKFCQINAFDTILGGMSNVYGSTVNVAAGTYNETIRLDATKPQNLTFVGEDKTTTFVTGGIRFEGNYSGLTVENFTITGDGRQRPGLAQATVGTSASANMVTDATFSNNIFDGQGADDGGPGGGRFGFYIDKIGGSFTFTGNEVKNFRGWGTMDLNQVFNPVTAYAFTDNNIHDNHGSSALRGSPSDRTDTVTVTGNMFTNNGNPAEDSWAALEVNEADSVTVTNNTITGTQSGSWGEGEALQFWHISPTTLTVQCNTIADNFQGIYFPGSTWASDLSGVHINYNNIQGNTQFGLQADAGNTNTADAENNWWGSATGPTHASNPGGSGDIVSDLVDFDPWLAQAQDQPCPPGVGGVMVLPADESGSSSGQWVYIVLAGAAAAFALTAGAWYAKRRLNR